MRPIRALAVAVSLFACAPAAYAQTADLSKTSCKEFMESGKEGIMIVWSYLYGFYADQDDDPVIDFTALTKKGQALAEYCKGNPTVDLVRAAAPIYDKKKK